MATQTIRIGVTPNEVIDLFGTDADPLGAPWQARINTFLTDFHAVGGAAIAESTAAEGYDDSAALLSGFTPDVDIVATIFKNASINNSARHECELLLRATQTTTVSRQIECLFEHGGTVQCVRWIDNGGQDFVVLTADSGPETMGRQFITGDRIRAKIIGSTITMSCIEANDAETVLGVFTDSTYATGQPGIGGFFRVGEGANQAHFCFLDVTVTDIW